MMNDEARTELFALLDHEVHGAEWILQALDTNTFNGADITRCAYGTIAYHDSGETEYFPYEDLRELIVPGMERYFLTPLEDAVSAIMPWELDQARRGMEEYQESLDQRTDLIEALRQWQEQKHESQ